MLMLINMSIATGQTRTMFDRLYHTQVPFSDSEYPAKEYGTLYRDEL